MAPPPAIAGQIDDNAIRLEQPRAGASVSLHLENVGNEPCMFVAVLTEMAPEALAVEDGRVVLDISGDTSAPDPMEAGIEVNGERVGGEPPDDPEQELEAAHTLLRPGDVARVQLALVGTPEQGERIILCNGPGDHAAGRYAVLPFER
ncbi:MAG: hypothetical protein H0V12_02145 [Chloroflexi bacterium]|nr:hypothetical protein [Chloroflexota bacterium]